MINAQCNCYTINFTVKEYGSKDLRGLTVEHGEDAFTEGKTVILTLKDKGWYGKN